MAKRWYKYMPVSGTPEHPLITSYFTPEYAEPRVAVTRPNSPHPEQPKKTVFSRLRSVVGKIIPIKVTSVLYIFTIFGFL